MGVGWQGQKGGHWAHRPLTQRRVGTLLTLGNVHIVLPRLHYRKAAGRPYPGPRADTPEFPPQPLTFNKTSQDSCTVAQRQAGRVLTSAASGLKEGKQRPWQWREQGDLTRTDERECG